MDNTMTAIRAGARGVSPEETFRGLFARHYGAVYGYAARRIGRDDAADAASDVFTVAWRRIRSVPDEPETLPWLYGVARKVVANHRRTQDRRDRLEAKAMAQTDRAFQPPEPVTDLDAALEQLRDEDREVLMLVAWEGLGPRGLASALGCSTNAATVRLHRARKRLSAVWEEEGGGGR